MSASLWTCSAEELLRRASSVDPTPGGGSIAAVTAAFGFSLVRMAVGVTLAAPDTTAADREMLLNAQTRLLEMQSSAVLAVDRDVTEFDAVMAAYRLPRDTGPQRDSRGQAIDAATVTATQGPLSLAETAIDGVALVGGIEHRIRPSIVSDAEAGRDLLKGAALAALRTADINLAALEQREHRDAPALRRRRDAVWDAAVDGRGQ